LDVQRLIHELQVHRVELEMQNEELRRTHDLVEQSRSRYADLYDFAPVGYFSLDRQGVIVESNLTGAVLLGVDRKHLLKRPFAQFVSVPSLARFRAHLAAVMTTSGRQSCEVSCLKKDGGSFPGLLESVGVRDERGRVVQCRMALSDISPLLRVAEALRETVALRELSSRRRGDKLTLIIEDNGKGFDVGEARTGVGLADIRERVEHAGGSLKITAAHGKGCRVRAVREVPPAGAPGS